MNEIDYKTYKYLFLDRDGVINIERPNDYVKNKSEFIFIDGAVDAITQLSRIFDKIFIITNQRGIGRGLFSETDLEDVHLFMISTIENRGGKIDKVYYCSDINNSSINRKPNIGMAFQVQRDFPYVDFEKSIFVGNSKSDILFGNKLNMLTVLVGNKYKPEDFIYKKINVYCKSLSKFADLVQESNTKLTK